jgi:predicted DNA-binding protein with PD1-like motif
MDLKDDMAKEPCSVVGVDMYIGAVGRVHIHFAFASSSGQQNSGQGREWARFAAEIYLECPTVPRHCTIEWS